MKNELPDRQIRGVVHFVSRFYYHVVLMLNQKSLSDPKNRNEEKNKHIY